MRVLLACPTIPERFPRREGLEKLWRERTPEADLEIVYSEAGTTWGDGLNDIYEQVRDNPPDLFVCGSDDMCPADERWEPSLRMWLDAGYFTVPRVDDPRFVNYGSSEGAHVEVQDGAPADMSTFPILKGEWLDKVFPVPEGLHYFADSWISLMCWRAGIKAVAVPTCRILHMHAKEGRGAGYENENTRLHVDTARYTDALNALGIDRLSLPANIRGGMWEDHFLEIGRLIQRPAA